MGLSEMEIDVKEHGETSAVLKLVGDFDIYNTVHLKKIVNELVDQGKKNIICDLKGVSYIDSSGIGALMVSLSLLKKADGRFILIHTYDAVKKVLEITKMTTFFEIFDSLNEALESIPE